MDYPVYYGVDENGNIVMSDSNSVLDESMVDLFPESASDLLEQPDTFEDSIEDSVSSGDETFYPSYDIPTASHIASELDIINYDQLIEALAAIPGYNTYPNTAAISVFDSVFVGNSHINYLCLADSDGTTMYYSDDYSLSGNTITLMSPVTQIRYYSTRSGTTTLYNYVVSTTGDISFTPTTQLVYTNLLKNYPSLPSDTRGVPGSGLFSGYSPIVTAIGIIFIASCVIKFVKEKI